MPNQGVVSSLWINRRKGTPGFNTMGVNFIAGRGIEGDYHCEDGPRQVSIISGEAYRWIDSTEETGLCLKKFKANILLDELNFNNMEPGMLLRIGSVVLRITEKNKLCFPQCELLESGRECRLSFGTCFAEVLRGGHVANGDMAVLDTMSNRISDSRPGTVLFQERLKKSEVENELDTQQKTAFKNVKLSDAVKESIKKITVEMENQRLAYVPVRERYARQIMIDEIGQSGQKKLSEASILVVGAGGLGNAIITALAQAGVGCIGIADGDKVSWSDLNRQYLYTPEDLGRKKTICAAKWLKRFRPDANIKVYDFDLTPPSLNRTVHNYDMVLVAVDNMETRLMVNRIARKKQVPLIDGSIDGYSGSITPVFHDNTPCLNCIYSSDSSDQDQENGEISAMGTASMILGAMQAQLAIRYIIGSDKGISNTMYRFDGTKMTLEEKKIKKDASCSVCGNTP